VRLKDLLNAKRTHIEGEFFKRTLSFYPEETASVLATKSDPFSNPVGAIIREATGAIVDGFLDESPVNRIAPAIEQIVRIRAVQDFTASEAVSFLFLFKQVIREELQPEAEDHELSADLDRLSSQLDELVLAAFNMYVACRDMITEIRLGEA